MNLLFQKKLLYLIDLDRKTYELVLSEQKKSAMEKDQKPILYMDIRSDTSTDYNKTGDSIL